MASEGCARCGQKRALGSQYCSQCKSYFAQLRPTIFSDLRRTMEQFGPLSAQWDQLIANITSTGFQSSAFLDPLRKECLNWLSRYQAFVLADGVVTDEERRNTYSAA